MFRWYRASRYCYAYLSDVLVDKRKVDYAIFQFSWELAFRTSKWFRRGWTLQELLAPRIVKFSSREGKLLGDKLSLEQQIHEITCIPALALRGTDMNNFTKEERMSWSSTRQTTREEDMAYSMLGLFGVSMVPIYGEGGEAAFKRLEREIRDSSFLTATSLDEEQKLILLDSLRFDQIDSRHLTIKSAHAKTCKWLLNTTAYHDWLDPALLEYHHGSLWIKGKPGTGKSTLMKSALAHARKTMKNWAVIAYFFNARDENLEKSTVGTYRSLLLQLLEQIPALHTVFESLALSARSIHTDHQWSDGSLQTLLEQAIQHLGQSQVVCFIHALDECEERQVRSMVSFFERISQLACSSNIRFLVCFSSRHYPEVTIKKGLSLVLEGIGKGKTAQQIRTNLQDKASGIFMWVVLVVEILNQEFDRDRMHALRKRLSEISADLHELFRDILTRDSRNKDELLLCIQWVLFANQPMSPEQLYFAILSGVEPDAITKWDPRELTMDIIRRFILDSSKGLVETTKSKAQKVQFIHESVRDFLIKENSLSNIWPDLESDFEGHSHEQLKQCCLNYLSLNLLDIQDYRLGVSKARDQEIRKPMIDDFPFLEYAVQCVLYHADIAQGAGPMQTSFMLNFPRTRWIHLDNILEKHRIRRHTDSISILYILAERNLANLISASPSIRSCFELEQERYGVPFLAAMATRSGEAIFAFVKALQIDTGPINHISNDLPLYYLDEYGNSLLSRDFNFPKDHGLIECLIKLGSPYVFALAITTTAVDLNLTFPRGRSYTPLTLAASMGHTAIVELLLVLGEVAVGLRDYYGHTPLMAAVQSEHGNIVKLLLDTGRTNVNKTDILGRTSLLWAVLSGNKEIVYALLADSNVDINLSDKNGRPPLMVAVTRGYSSIAEMLLKTDKANVNVHDCTGSTPFQSAATKGQMVMVELLLSTRKVYLDAKDVEGRTAFLLAASRGHVNVVDRLSALKDVDVGACDHRRGTALKLAAGSGHSDVVELLLRMDNVKVNERNTAGRTALMLSTREGHRDVVKLLLSVGEIDVNLEDERSLTALMLAAGQGHGNIAALLLSTGKARVNKRDYQEETALTKAEKKGYKDVYKLLKLYTEHST
ncbi:hypothetical protein N0V94_004107 [Neodidymelliopsis sp. IMI 364377]|nr:hypothetical protein N0V94_004107 [Neodidymelliopsis sp. IMI 364377]